MFWNDEFNVQVRTFSAHHIDLEIREGPGDPQWRLTGFYGYSCTTERDRSWQLLRDLHDLDALPWVVIGDFNEILNNSEKVDGPLRTERQMRGFRDALGYGDMLDLGYQGVMSAWWNSSTRLRLDRAVCTPCWFDIFGYARVRHLPPSDSDHVPILLQASPTSVSQRPRHKCFKFEAFWLKHGDCNGVVKDAWSTNVVGSPMFSVVRKIEHTRLKLDVWQRQTFKERQQQMMGIRERLEIHLNTPNSSKVQNEKKYLMGHLQIFLSQEEAFWRQRSKVVWLKEGDRNTGFFHRKAANRERKNTIPGLYSENGQWCDDDEGMEKVVTDYFTNMFSASDIDLEAVETTLAAIHPCVTQSMNEQLCVVCSHKEIRNALFQMYPTKSPGPDGMPPLFFQHYWDVVGAEVTEAVQGFMQSGRLITDNILVANEIAHFVHNKKEGGDRFMALKLDLSKAYDRMEWTFLRKVLDRFGFAYSWIEMVMQCVTTISMLYAQAPLEDCYQIQNVIETYGRASGQLVNFDKSSVVFSKNISSFMQEEVSSLMGVEVVASHERYLGLPTYVGRKKTSTFHYIKENLAKKLSCWQGKLLSGAGKDILIRVVAQALPSYAMSVFQLTKDFCEDLEHMCARFWWGSTNDKRKIHWKTWNALCNPKEEGGLGFQSLSNFNFVLLAKQAWRVLCNPNSLIARIYKARYFPTETFWTVDLHPSPSYSWRSIFSTRELLQQSAYWQIGNGVNVNIWSDSWIPNLQNGKPDINEAALAEVDIWRHKWIPDTFPRCPSSPPREDAPRFVSELIDPVHRVWDVQTLNLFFSPADIDLILSIPLSRSVTADRVVWHFDKKGMFTTNSAYFVAKDIALGAVLAPPTPVDPLAKLWKAIWGAKLEDNLHLFFHCPYAQETWNAASINMQVPATLTFQEYFLQLAVSFSKDAFAKLLVIVWAIWKNRNSQLWDNTKQRPSEASMLSLGWLQEFSKANAQDADLSSLGILITEVKDFMRRHVDYKVVHVSCEANKVAHVLANHALHWNESQSWFVVAPECVRDAILSDCNH
ncbi:uncharacterized protein LOC112177844 [Rosa chinensis]|uniref:uncharacterized protein LOC112177844 n=1 Tax=Rosa chinensis TaxID=74649 RepID=UPI000D095342|nr:uncharacterized protein LOC112177844 [Rosa chinensis]